jgi:DNA-binding protein Fis
LPLAALGLRFDDVERDLLAAAWEQGGHNQTRAAELLGLPRQAFVYRLKKHGLLAADVRDGEAEG